MTNKWQQLTAEFGEEDLYEKHSRTGRTFTHIRCRALLERLNSVLGPGGWSFEVLSFEVLADNRTVIVQGGLEIQGTRITQYGSAEYGVDNGQAQLSLADAVKAATSDVLARCCCFFGAGLYLRRQPTTTPSPKQNRAQHTPPTTDQISLLSG